MASALITGIAIFASAGIAIKGLGIAFSLVKGTILGLLSPLKLFKKGTQEVCKTVACVNKLSESFSLLGERLKSLKGIRGLFRGLKFGRFLLGFGPAGIALAAAPLLPDLYNFVKNSEFGSKLISGVKDIGSSIISGLKGLLGFGEKETTEREVVKEIEKFEKKERKYCI